ASLGISFTSSSSALDAPITERISIQWPSSIMSINVASSQKKSIPSNPKTVNELYTEATNIANPISVIMPGLLSFNSSNAPVINGQPPYKKINGESANKINSSFENRQSTQINNGSIGEKIRIGNVTCRKK